MSQPTFRPSGAFLGAITGALIGAFAPPARMMLSGSGVIIFIIGGALVGMLAGMAAQALYRDTSNSPGNR